MDGTLPFMTMYLDGVSYPVLPTEQYINLATFANKVTFGDFTRDSDTLISAKIYTDLSGGIGVLNGREGSDDGRYWTGTLDVTRPYQWALPRRTVMVSGPSFPLGDFASTFLAASTTNLYQWNETTDTFTSIGSLADAPVMRGVEFAGKFFIPESDGFQTWDGLTLSAQDTSIKAIHFIEWDERLWALTSDRKLMYTMDGAVWIQAGATLHESVVPKRLVLYLNSSSDDSVYIMTSSGLYFYDPLTERIGLTRVQFPPHPDNGSGAAMWRLGEDAYLAAGMQCYRWTFSTISQMGPMSGDGMPAEYRGRIVDLCSEHNAMYALIEGTSSTGASSGIPAILDDPGMLQDDQLTGAATSSVSTLLYWTGFGWHHAWVGGSATPGPTWIQVSGANSTYRLWWGHGGNLYTQVLPRTFASARQLIDAKEGDFATTGFIETAWFDAGMQMFYKLGSHVEGIIRDMPSGGSVAVEYKIDQESNGWQSLTSLTAAGEFEYPFSAAAVNTGQFSNGLAFRRIRFRLTVTSPSSTTSPIIDSFVLKFIKVPFGGSSWTISVPLSFNEWDGRTPEQIKRDLDALSTSRKMVRLVHGSDYKRSRRVYVARVGGNNGTGEDDRGFRDLTLVEVPLAGWDGNNG